MIPTEHDEQKALFQWAAANARVHPSLSLLYAIPNGGHRHKAVAAKLKAEGVKRGVPDICLPVSNADFNGLYIELKRRKNSSASSEQRKWISSLQGQGYQAVVCKGWDEARKVIQNYLQIGGVV